jgi:hypothetical protein
MISEKGITSAFLKTKVEKGTGIPEQGPFAGSPLEVGV